MHAASSPIAAGTYSNPVLPPRPEDIRTMPEAEWCDYRANLLRLVCSSAEHDAIRREALERLLEADGRLWTRRVANMAPPVAPIDGWHFIDPSKGRPRR